MSPHAPEDAQRLLQVPWVFVAGADNGVYVLDASDPSQPVLAAQHHFEPTLRASQVASSAIDGSRTRRKDRAPGHFDSGGNGGYVKDEHAFVGELERACLERRRFVSSSWIASAVSL